MEYINLESDELSSEDKLFFSPIATYKIFIVGKDNTNVSIYQHLVREKLLNRVNVEIFSAAFDTSSNISFNINKTEIDTSDINSVYSLDTSYFYDHMIILDKDIKYGNLPQYKNLTHDNIFEGLQFDTAELGNLTNTLTGHIAKINFII